jgi:UDP-N-acetylglucosamine 2-epimerase (non-hydrolysing)
MRHGSKILNVVGARPNFMKASPIIEAIRARSEQNRADGREEISQILVHTGQHYDQQMSKLFFDQLGMPSPDVNLEVGSGSHAVQTAEVMKRFETVCVAQKPSHILVVGDVNSTLACALVGVKLGISVAHVEAGLRSFDRRMPEEINRIMTDSISDYLFTTEESANVNLRREGIPDEKVHFVGNVMIDTLLKHLKTAERSAILERLGLDGTGDAVRPYGVLTLHRAETVDDRQRFREMLEALAQIAKELPIIFPVHPRTRKRIEEFAFGEFFEGATEGIRAVEPLAYLDFLRLMSRARVVLTDSGGIQEETTVLGVPCVTLRDSTERPVTTLEGTNVLAGTKRDDILSKTHSQLGRSSNGLAGQPQTPLSCTPPLWDGKAAERIVDVLFGRNGVEK